MKDGGWEGFRWLTWLSVACALVLISATAAGKDMDALVECSTEVQTVNVTMYTSENQMRAMYAKLGARWPSKGLRGFATYNTRTKVHTLHVLRISGTNSKHLKTLGHELLHALCGDWHSGEKYDD